MKFAACLDDRGRLVFEDAAAFERWALRTPGLLVDVLVEPRSDKASDRQRKFWFGTIVKEFGTDSGHDRDELHDFHLSLLRQFAGTHVVDGVEVANLTSWNDLSMRQAYELMEWAVRFAAKHGTVIRFPSELRDEMAAFKEQGDE